jgi:hypothetical protein
MPDEVRLREQAREAIKKSRLPARPPDRTGGGPGEGLACAVCQRPVTKDEMEFEIEFVHDGRTPKIDKYHVHVRCFAAWEFERNKPPQS